MPDADADDWAFYLRHVHWFIYLQMYWASHFISDDGFEALMLADMPLMHWLPLMRHYAITYTWAISLIIIYISHITPLPRLLWYLSIIIDLTLFYLHYWPLRCHYATAYHYAIVITFSLIHYVCYNMITYFHYTFSLRLFIWCHIDAIAIITWCITIYDIIINIYAVDIDDAATFMLLILMMILPLLHITPLPYWLLHLSLIDVSLIFELPMMPIYITILIHYITIIHWLSFTYIAITLSLGWPLSI